jgi:hypothetical protein
VNQSPTSQTDNCDPGLVCVMESCGNSCAKFCRTDADCPGATCTRSLAGGFKACDVQASTCNPVTMLMGAACPASAQECYLSSTTPDRTICDCPVGCQGNGASCGDSRECLPGLTCADPTNGNDLRCHPACSLTGASGCPGTQVCRAIKGSQKFGVCN